MNATTSPLDNTAMPSKFLMRAKRNDVFRMVLAGGGGYGDPLERDPERVTEDVREEKLSREYAQREYGVVLNPQTLEVDQAATATLRQHLAAASMGKEEKKRGDTCEGPASASGRTRML